MRRKTTGSRMRQGTSNMATPAAKKRKLTEEEAAERAVEVLERYLARQTPEERKKKLERFYKGAARIRETRAK